MAKTVLSLRDLAGLVLFEAGVWAGTCILLVGVMLYEMGDLDAPIDFVPGISEQIIEGLFLTVTLAAGLSIAGCSLIQATFPASVPALSRPTSLPDPVPSTIRPPGTPVP